MDNEDNKKLQEKLANEIRDVLVPYQNKIESTEAVEILLYNAAYFLKYSPEGKKAFLEFFESIIERVHLTKSFMKSLFKKEDEK